MCGGPKPQQPVVQQAAPPPSRESIKADIKKEDTEIAKEKKRVLNKRGRKSTILTSSLGINEDPNTARKRLLGA